MLVAGGDGSIRLTPEPQGLPHAVRRKFPHLASLPVLRLPADAASQGALAAVLRAQCAVVASRGGTLAAATGAALLAQMNGLRPPCTALPHVGVVARAAAAKGPTPRMWPSPVAQSSTSDCDVQSCMVMHVQHWGLACGEETVNMHMPVRQARRHPHTLTRNTF